MKQLSILLVFVSILTSDIASAAQRGEPNSPERAKYCAIKLAICKSSFPDSYCEGKNTSQALQHCEDTFGAKSNCKSRSIM
jgi:hypothetical protein